MTTIQRDNKVINRVISKECEIQPMYKECSCRMAARSLPILHGCATSRLFHDKTTIRLVPQLSLGVFESGGVVRV